jgi:hypothetical protein
MDLARGVDSLAFIWLFSVKKKRITLKVFREYVDLFKWCGEKIGLFVKSVGRSEVFRYGRAPRGDRVSIALCQGGGLTMLLTLLVRVQMR